MREDKPTKYILKGYAGRHISDYEDDSDRTMMYNGIEVKWFIGDINWSRAKELGLTKPYEKDGYTTSGEGPYWEAWGSCLGKAYQLSAWFNKETKELSDIEPIYDPDNSYFNQEIYNKLKS